MFRPHVHLERLVNESRHLFEIGLRLSPRIERMTADLLELALAGSHGLVGPDGAIGRTCGVVGSGLRSGGVASARRIYRQAHPCQIWATT